MIGIGIGTGNGNETQTGMCVKSENVLRVEPIKCHLSARESKVIDSLLIYSTLLR